MRRSFYLSLFLVGTLSVGAVRVHALTVEEMARGFENPPPSARPQTWWHWMNSNVSSNGITADLEAMADIGLGGACIFNVAFGIPEGSVPFNNPAWLGMVRHAAAEARRLGLELGIHNCAGWSSSGGPWNVPSNSMKVVTFSEHRVSGPTAFAGKLEQPRSAQGFYRDIAILALPSATNVVDRVKIVDLTRVMGADGSLSWQVPPGDWTILRAGYTTNERQNKWGGPYGTGLECDKLDSGAAQAHWDGSMRKVLDALGPLAGSVTSGLNGVSIDSYEVEGQNWTGGLEKLFLERRGYDMLPFLPVFAGFVVDSPDVTARFKWDFNRVVADLFAENYAGAFRTMAHRAGLKFSCEGYGGGPFDELQYSSYADIPMAEFVMQDRPHMGNARLAASVAHVYGRKIVGAEAFTAWPDVVGPWCQDPYALKPLNDTVYCGGVNRMIYHRYAHQPWTNPTRYPGLTMGPFGVQFERTQTWWRQGRSWVTYQSRCQYLLQEGQFVADACFYCGEDAPARMTGAMPVGYAFDGCDAAALLLMRVEGGRIVLPSGMSYSLLVLPKAPAMSPEILRTIARLADAGARIIGPAPARATGLRGYPYADAEVCRLADALWLTKIRDIPLRQALAEAALLPDCIAEGEREPIPFIHRTIAGAEVYFVVNNQRIARTFSCTFRVAGRVPELWDAETGSRLHVPAYEIRHGRTTLPMRFEPAGSVFVVFDKPDAGDHVERVDVTPAEAMYEWRADAKNAPVLWAGAQADATATTATGVVRRASVTNVPPPVGVKGPWTLDFPSGWGAPPSVTLDKLISWTEHPDSGVRYFSGTATYRAAFHWAGPSRTDERYLLDLGDLRNLAELELNGRSFPVLWKPPFRQDVTEAIRQGRNELVVKVTNLWPNRLIGDEQLPDDREWGGPPPKKVPLFMGRSLTAIPDWVVSGKPSPTGRITFTTWWHWKKDDHLLPSGLFGPVELKTVRRMDFNSTEQVMDSNRR